MAEQSELDEVFSKYKQTVNMSASELERWADNPCSRKASLDRSPITRNLRLLRKPKAEWTANDIKDANRTISFVSRMKKAEQGKQVSSDCSISKRDISLKNWAYDPDKNKESAMTDEITKTSDDVDEKSYMSEMDIERQNMKMDCEEYPMKMDMTMSAMTFDELDQMEAIEEAKRKAERDIYLFPKMAEKIMYSIDEEMDKPGMMRKLADQLVKRVSNAFTAMKQKAMKTEGGVEYPASDYAYVPDPEMPSTWKLRLSPAGNPGERTVAQLGRAAAAFSPGGFRGQKVEIPSGQRQAVKDKIMAEYSKLGVDKADVPPSLKGINDGMFIFKSADTGLYHWVAVYSNNYRDDDSPPEIISAQAHKDFIKSVDDGVNPYPELWLWHTPELKIGQTTWMAWDDAGFSVAGGYFDKEASEIAKALMKKDNVLVSHGMPRQHVVRDTDDPTVIIQYVSKEISPLASYAAANRWTGFITLPDSEEKMISPEKKLEFEKALGIDSSVLEKIEQRNKSIADINADLGIQKKEKDEVAEEPQDEAEVDQAPEAEAQTEPEPQEEPDTVTREEVFEAMKQISDANVQMAELIKALKDEIDELKGKQQQEAAEAAEKQQRRPLAAMLSDYRAVGNPDTKMKQGERSNGPKETNDDAPRAGRLPGIVQAIKSGSDHEYLQKLKEYAANQ